MRTHAGQAEIDDHRAPGSIDKNIHRLDVKVHQASIVQGSGCVDDAFKQFKPLRSFHIPPRLVEFEAVNPSHDQEGTCGIDVHLVHRADSGVSKSSHGACFLEQAISKAARLDILEELDGDLAIQSFIVGDEDEAHAATSGEAFEAIPVTGNFLGGAKVQRDGGVL
jgi:hypothetical protein